MEKFFNPEEMKNAFYLFDDEEDKEQIMDMKNLTQAVILCGLPGSGKSTFVKKNCYDYVQISRDIIRYELGYVSSPEEKVRLTREQEERVTDVEYKMIKTCLKKKKNFVVDDTNTSLYYRTKMLDYIKQWDDVFIIGVNFNTPVSVCIRRRKGQIPAEDIRNIADRMVPISRDEVDDLIEVD